MGGQYVQDELVLEGLIMLLHTTAAWEGPLFYVVMILLDLV